MYYGDDVIEEVRARNDIVDVVSQVVHLQKKGANYFGLCPFHNEKTPSFSVTPAKQMFYCFGCGTGGNVFTFIQKYENLSWQEAVEHLAQRAGYTLPGEDRSQKAKQEQDRRKVLLAVNKEAATWFYHNLRAEKGKTGLAYFENRGLTKETLNRFGLGFAPVSRDALVQHLRSKGYADKEILDAGVAVMDEREGLRDKFWNRVMFPIQDANGRVIGFGGRVLGQGEPKYLNSPETKVFDKSRNLYGLYYAKNARKGHFILCEGYMDVIAMHQAGFPQAVASLGTSFTAGQASLLKRYTDEALLAYDSDEAGTRAALRCVELLRNAGLRARVIDLRPHKDPDEFVKHEGTEALQTRITNAENAFLFEVSVEERRFHLQDPDEKTAFHNRLAQLLAIRFQDPIGRENYLQSVCAAYHIDPQAMRDLVARVALKEGGRAPDPYAEQTVQRKTVRRDVRDERLKPQRRLLSWLAEDAALFPVVAKYVKPDDFADGMYRLLAEEIFRGYEDGTFLASRLVDRFEEDEQNEVARLLNEEGEGFETNEERARALHEVIESVLRFSAEAVKEESDPSDADYLTKVTQAKKRMQAFAGVRLAL